MVGVTKCVNIQDRDTTKGASMKRIISVAIMLVIGANAVFGTNGVAVSVDWSDLPKSVDSGVEGMHLDLVPNSGRYLYRYDITNNTPGQEDTLCTDICVYPKINIEGTKVAFYRKDSDGEWHLSVINADGTELTDLDDFGSNCEGNPVLAWPAGEYIYYYKPGESNYPIWKVSAADKNDKSFVWSCDRILRFTLSADKSRCAIRGFPGMGNHAINSWPPDTQYTAATVGISYDEDKGDGRVAQCNIQMSVSGSYLTTYIQYNHYYVSLHKWDETNTVSFIEDIDNSMKRDWTGSDVTGKGKYIRTCSNSDKWFSEQVSSYLNFDYGNVFVNWADRSGFSLGEFRSPGDFWVRPPSGKEGMIELADGTWKDVGLDPTGTRAPKTRNAVVSGSSVRPKLHLVRTQGSITPVIRLGDQAGEVDFRGRLLNPAR